MTPSEILERYLYAWQKQDWFTMSGFLQKHSRLYGYGPKKLKEEHGDIKLHSFKVTGVKVISDVCQHVTAALIISVPSRPKMKMPVCACVVKEDRPGNPSPAGAWGVAPGSVQRYKDAVAV